MRSRRPSWIALCLLATLGAAEAVGAAAASGPDPRWEVDADGYLTAKRLPCVLEEAVIEENLTSGLTTSFVLVAEPRPRGKKSGGRGGARIDVRYELWDELYQVTVLNSDGAREHRVLASAEALRAWWRTLEVRLLHLGSTARSAGGRVHVTFTVVPFSRSEQRDAQRWLTESAARAGGDGARQAPEKNEPAGGIAEVLIATSIGRRALLTRHWRVELEDVPRQRPQRDR